ERACGRSGSDSSGFARAHGSRDEFGIDSIRILPQEISLARFLRSHVSMDAKSGHGNRRTGGILIGIGILSLLLTACAMNRDTRTQAEKDRDAELWTHALS